MVLAKTQDRRREPKLKAAFIGGDYTVDVPKGARTYHIRLSISNVSDSDNAVTRAELRLKYRLREGADITVRLQQLNSDDQLQLPMRVAAHDAVAGWCRFLVMPEILRGNSIESYNIELTDAHDEMVSVAPLIMSERRSDR